MARPDKAAAVAELTEEFRSSGGAVLTDYRGLTVKQLQELRRVLGDSATYAVVKNTLTKIAAQEAGFSGFDDLLVGPTAIAFIKGDAVEVAKGLRDFAKTYPPLVIKGGILDGKTLSVAEIAKIADLESREVLLGKLAGALLASLQNAVYLFNEPLAQAARLAGALQAKAEQDPSILGGGAGEPAPQSTDDASTSVESTEPADSVATTPAVDAAPEADSAPEVDTTPQDAAPAADDAASATDETPALDATGDVAVVAEVGDTVVVDEDDVIDPLADPTSGSATAGDPSSESPTTAG
jgi:large subunit ribosomal protein L10